MLRRQSAGPFRIAVLVAGVFVCPSATVRLAGAQKPDGRALDPVVIWPTGPLEVVAAFDRPVEDGMANRLVGRSVGYLQSAAADQARTSATGAKGALRIVAARLADSRRTLILATDPHPCVARYFLPANEPEANATTNSGGERGLTYDLTGVEAAWSPEGAPGGETAWSLWWPHLDTEVLTRVTRGSRRHEEAYRLLTQPGQLTLSALVRLPAGNATLRLESSNPIEEAVLGDASVDAADPAPKSSSHQVSLAVGSQGEPVFLTITARTGGDGAIRPFALAASYRMGDERTVHHFKREQLLLPWAPLAAAPSTAAPLLVPDLSGGDPARGKALFLAEQARCSQCHTFRGQGTLVGPDLTEIGQKGRAEIYRAIAAPSASIEPDYVSYTVATRNGQVLVGVVRALDATTIRVTDTNARATLIERSKIQQIRPSATSIMPVGLTAALGDAAMRDLIAFLTSSEREADRNEPESLARLLSFDALQRRLSEPKLRLLDVREKPEYTRGHIPGAVWIDLKAAQQLSATEQGMTNRGAWEKWLEPLGIEPGMEIVIYDGQRQLSAARLWWLLTYLGAPVVSLVDGGYPLWSKQGRPVTTEFPQVAPRPFPVRFQNNRYAHRADVVKALASGAARIVDARSATEFSGQELRSKRGGHIPTACHLEWNTLVDADGRFLDPTTLRLKLEAFGVTAGHAVITHCQSGGRASVNAFVLERLGFPTQNYYLGWSDWGNSDETPVQAGTRQGTRK
jgi:thiosulfate/3-mercaptopyruvate sulfurtransferase